VALGNLVDIRANQLRGTLASRVSGFYARSVYLPTSVITRKLRLTSRKWRGVERIHEQRTNLLAVNWSEVFEAKPIRLAEVHKQAGNVSFGELGVLASAAAAVEPGRQIIEIGTFDGRTTLNLAINAPADVEVITLDLPPDVPTRYAPAPGERVFVEKPLPGERFRCAAPPWAERTAKIRQVLGDSTKYDWSVHFGRAGLVFVDGSHAYDCVLADSENALKLLADKGVVIWHDYGVWDGVTRALEAFEAKYRLGLTHISGTTLAVFKAP
jgi:hypothetical protein